MGKDLPNADPTIFAPCSESDVQTASNTANSLGAKVQTDIATNHVAWTVSSTAYLRNLDEEDLERECIAIHHQNAPKRNESGGTTLSVKCPALIVSLYYEPREIADRVAAILNAHWDTFEDGNVVTPAWCFDMSKAPRDGSYILAIVAPNRGRHLEHQAGRVFSIRHEGKTASDFDLGWAVYPGFGGASDHDFCAWMPMPPVPAQEVNAHG